MVMSHLCYGEGLPREGSKSFVLGGQSRPRIPATPISSLRTLLGTLAVSDRKDVGFWLKQFWFESHLHHFLPCCFILLNPFIHPKNWNKETRSQGGCTNYMK